jgi:CO/xanthine dehydrogenase Mo-binding subunit
VFWGYNVIAAGERGAAHFYDIPNHKTTVAGGWGGNATGLHPFAIGPWRAPGNSSNTFARESHVDQLAAKAGADPVEFRMANLSDERMKRVLRAAASQFGWSPAPAPSGRGWGVALGSDAGTYVATMAEVRVDGSSGKVGVVRIVSVQDMGVVVNPDGARQQMEGCIAQGLGYVFTEEVHFKNGQVLDRNFDTYDLPRFSWMPKVETTILDSPALPAQGGGEPAIIVMGAVVANAIFDAVGARLRQMPFAPDRVKAAIVSARSSM